MLNKRVFFVVACCAVSFTAFAAGSESFANLTTYTTTVKSMAFTGDNGQAWNVIGTTDYELDGTCVTLWAYDESGNDISGRFSDEQLAQGVGTVTFQVRAATGATVGWGTRSFVVSVGATQVTVTGTITNTSTTVTYSADINLTAAQLSSDATLHIKMNGVASGETGFMVDNITWTSYSGLTETPLIAIDAYQDALTQVYWGTDIKAYLTTSTPDAVFYYTLDGTEPSISSPQYTATGIVLPLDVPTTIKAIAVTEAKGTSEVATLSVITASGIVYRDSCNVILPNDLWESSGSIQTKTSTGKGNTFSGEPFLYMSSKASSLVSEAYVDPQAFSVYAASSGKAAVRFYYQEGTYEITSGVYTWTPSTNEWTEFGAVRRTSSGTMARYDLSLPEAVKSKVVRFKAVDSTYIYLDDITVVTKVNNQAASPVFSQPGGDVDANTKIRLSCPEGTTLHYTVNNDTEQTSTTDVEFTITRKMAIKAFATKEGLHDSYCVVETYQLPTVATPEVSKPSGSVLSIGEILTVSCTTPNATLSYQVNGGDIKTTNATAEIEVTADYRSLKAWAVCEGLINSDTVYCVYSIQKVSTPYWNTEQRAVAPGTQVGLTCNMFGATLVYQINDQGWIQTGTSSTLLTIDQPCTVYAYATKDNYLNSDTLCEVFTVTKGTLPAPTADYADGALLANGTQVTFTAEAGTTLNYRVNDGVWQTADAIVTLTITEATTVEVYASQTDYSDSEHVIFVYTIAKGKVATPYVTSGDERAVASGTIININCSTENATMHYELNGNGVWETSFGTNGLDVTITAETIIRAYATRTNYLQSDTLIVHYTIATPSGIPTTDFVDGRVLAHNGQIVVSHANHQPVRVYTLLGQLLFVRHDVDDCRFAVNAGLYVVCVGTQVHKVLVR